MKKILSIVMTIILSICLITGCASSNTKFRSYYEGGLDLISLSRELVSSEEFVKSYHITEDQRMLLKKLTETDFSKPTVVFSLNISEITLESLSVDVSKCSENVKTYLLNNAMTSIASMINIKSGGENAAIASSVASVSMSFDHIGAEEPLMNWYIFENGVSFAVNFKPGYDNSVSAVATPVFDDALANCKDINDMVNYLKAYNIVADPTDISIIFGA